MDNETKSSNEKGMKSKLFNVLSYGWNWPDVPANSYTADERKELRRYCESFSAVAAVTSAGICLSKDFTAGAAIGLSAACVIGGYYLGGAIFNKFRKPSP